MGRLVDPEKPDSRLVEPEAADEKIAVKESCSGRIVGDGGGRIVRPRMIDADDERTYFQRHPVQFVLLLFAVVAALVFFGFRAAHGDTIYLNDGRSFHGKVYSGTDSQGRVLSDKVYRVEFSKGYMDIAKDRVMKIEENDKDSFKDHNYDLED